MGINRILSVITGIILGVQLMAQGNTEPSSSFLSPYRNAFLEIPQNTAALIGNYSDQTWFLSPGYYNPNIQQEVNASFYSSGNGIANHFAIMYALPKLGEKNLQFGLVINSVSDIPYTIQLKNDSGFVDYSRISSFSNIHTALQGHYAQPIQAIPNLNIGATAQVLYFKYGNFAQAFGLVLDLGVSGMLKKARWQASIQDITSSPIFWTYSFSEEDIQALENSGNSAPENGIDAGAPSIQADIHYPFSFSFMPKFEYELHASLVYQFAQGLGILDTKAGSISPGLGITAQYLNNLTFGLNSGNLFAINEGFTFDQSTNTFIETDELSYSLNPSALVGFDIANFSFQYALQYQVIPNSSAILNNLFSIQYKLKKQN